MSGLLIVLTYKYITTVLVIVYLVTIYNEHNLLVCLLLMSFTGENQNLSKQNFWQGTTTETGKYAEAMLYGLFAYQGWSYLNFVVDELQEPRKNLPKGIIMSLVGCTSIYLLANLAYFAVLNKTEILQSVAVAIVSLRRMHNHLSR